MDLTRSDYQQQLMRLLPEGPVWPRDPDTFIAKIIGAMADSLVAVDGRADDVMRESDPRNTVELLADWERNFGLPDGCLPLGASPDERRRRLHQKVVWQGGQSRQFYLDALAALGYPGATITEFRPFRANSKCNAALNQNGWRFAWRINVPADATIRTMNAGSPCDAALRSWGDASLLCILSAYKPAHTVLFVAYGDFS